MTGHEMCVHTDQSPHNRNMTLGIEECETTYWEWAEKDCVVSECYWEWHNVDASVGMRHSRVRSNKKWSLSWKALILIPASCVKPNIQLTKAWTGLCERHFFTPYLVLPFNLFFFILFLSSLKLGLFHISFHLSNIYCLYITKANQTCNNIHTAYVPMWPSHVPKHTDSEKTDLKQNITLKALAEIAHALSRPAEIHRH